jgi:hypothetical protein
LTVLSTENDDYGKVDPEGKLSKRQLDLLNNFQDEDRLSFFVSKLAWDFCQKKYPDFIPRFVIERHEMVKRFADYPTSRKGAAKHVAAAAAMVEDALDGISGVEKMQIELGRVMLMFSKICKHPLSGLGMYHQNDGSEAESIREMMQLTEQRLQEIERRYE